MKSKFNTKKCERCVYRGAVSGSSKFKYAKNVSNVICNYSGITGHTCLYSDANNNTCDRRGDVFEDCKLFVEGKMLKNKERNTFRSCRF